MRFAAFKTDLPWLPCLLLAAFAMSAWKLWMRVPSSELATAIRPAASVAASPAETLAAAAPNGARQPLLSNGNVGPRTSFVSAAPGQAVHAPSVVELNNGDLRAVWFSGSREGAKDVTVQTAVMDASSLRWSAETILFERHQIESQLWRYVKKIGNPVISRAPDGSLHLWMVNVSLGGWAGSSLSWARSTDEGTTWSRTRRLVTSPFLNISTLAKGAPFAYANGQTGLPVYHEFVTKLSEVLRLDTDGRVLDKVRIPASHTSLQPVVLVTGSSTASMYMRSGNATALMASHTDNAGRTWSAAHATALPNPDSAVAGIVSGDGRHWLALNATTDNRRTLALAASDKRIGMDATLLKKIEAPVLPDRQISTAEFEQLLGKELEEHGVEAADVGAYVASARRQLCGPERCSPEFSYPYLLQSRDGFLHLVYTWHRTRIKHVRLDPAVFYLTTDVPPSH
ncbi:MAG: hypothetical protein JWP47_1452 [Polaromonas sp.]|jgi:predicted neuraminidase|nr:hypothetical protein [Polaromonas sp.]